MHRTNSTHHSASITIRAADVADRGALRRIAERDSTTVPDGNLLLAEVSGEAQAAIALATGDVIADPFRPTAELVRMLSLRRAQLRGKVARTRRLAFSRAPSNPRLEIATSRPQAIRQ